MMRRRERPFPRALERALHGAGGTRAPSDPLRAPEDWELVVAATQLSLLEAAGERPPADLGTKLTRLLEPAREPSR